MSLESLNGHPKEIICPTYLSSSKMLKLPNSTCDQSIQQDSSRGGIETDSCNLRDDLVIIESSNEFKEFHLSYNEWGKIQPKMIIISCTLNGLTFLTKDLNYFIHYA